MKKVNIKIKGYDQGEWYLISDIIALNAYKKHYNYTSTISDIKYKRDGKYSQMTPESRLHNFWSTIGIANRFSPYFNEKDKMINLEIMTNTIIPDRFRDFKYKMMKKYIDEGKMILANEKGSYFPMNETVEICYLNN